MYSKGKILNMIIDNSKTIAVVGNSTNLLNNNYSKLIDSHDLVIRFNQARVKGYEVNVGCKTSMRMINHHVFTGTTNASQFSKYDINFIPSVDEPLILCKFLPNYKNIAKSRNIKASVSYVTDEVYYEAANMLKGGKDPTMGFIGIIFALKMSSKVSIFGFDLNKTNNPSHYWEKTNNMGATQFHNFNIENNKIRDLIKENKIKYYE